MANPELVRFHPAHQNSGSISDQTHQGNPGRNSAQDLFPEYPGTNVQKSSQPINKGNYRQY
jgi:hypothetical protein